MMLSNFGGRRETAKWKRPYPKLTADIRRLIVLAGMAFNPPPPPEEEEDLKREEENKMNSTLKMVVFVLYLYPSKYKEHENTSR